MKQGEKFNELSDDNPVQKQLLVHKQNTDKTLREILGAAPQTKLSALRAFARAQKQRSKKIVPLENTT